MPDGGGRSDADADAVNDHQSKASQEADSADAVTFDRNGWRREQCWSAERLPPSMQK